MTDPLNEIRSAAKREQDQRETEELKADIARRRHERLVAEILERKPPAPEPSLVQNEVKAEIRREYRAHVQGEIESFASIIGEETGRIHKEINNDAANRQAVVRKEIGEVRAEVHVTADRLRTEFRDSMARSASKLLELREIRESAMHDLQKQIFELQREVFLLREQLGNQRRERIFDVARGAAEPVVFNGTGRHG